MRRRHVAGVGALLAAALAGACGLFPDPSKFVGDGEDGVGPGEDGGIASDASADGAAGDAGCIEIPPDPTVLGDALHVTVGNGFACAVRSNGTVVCWGQSYRGQFGVVPDGGIGRPSTDRSATPVTVAGLANITALSAGDSHVCALDAERHVWCWGWNSQGQIGNGEVSPTRGTRYQMGGEVIDWDPAPALVQTQSGGPVQRAIAIASGLNHSCAILEGGVITCWGDNLFGELGQPGGRDAGASQNLIETRAVSSALSRGGAVSVTAGNGCSCAAIDGTPSTVECVGSNASNQLGAAPPDSGIPVTMPLPPSAGKPRTVFASFYASSHILVLDAAGNAFGSGNNSGGALGSFSSSQPAAVPGLSSANVASVATGPTHTCAILVDGTVQCIGGNDRGQLGRGFTSGLQTNPDFVEGPSPPGALMLDAGDGTRLANVAEVSVGYAQTCAIVKNACRRDGIVHCWGFNIVGELGDGTFDDRSRPVRVVRP